MGSATASHYEVLQLRSDASGDDVRQAWRRLARQHHPDHGGSADAALMARINLAYEVLADPHRRTLHDLELRQARAAAARPARALPRGRRAAVLLAGAVTSVAAGWVALRPAAPLSAPVAAGSDADPAPRLQLARELQALPATQRTAARESPALR